jgi:virginiamycin A acetyltransferase
VKYFKSNLNVGRNTVVKDTNVGQDVIIYNDIYIRGSEIGNNSKFFDRCRIAYSKLEGYNKIDQDCFFSFSEIGRGTSTNKNTRVMHAQIGRMCSVSWNVSIGAPNHNMHSVSMQTSVNWKDKFGIEIPSPPRDRVTIGNGVWIGAGAIILAGVSVGNGAVIGAGSIVTKNVSAYSVVAGAPAKKLKMRFEDKTAMRIDSSKWWDWPVETMKKKAILLSEDIGENTIDEITEISMHLKAIGIAVEP